MKPTNHNSLWVPKVRARARTWVNKPGEAHPICLFLVMGRLKKTNALNQGQASCSSFHFGRDGKFEDGYTT
jgi:hypothetical protein